ncbi:hypothetical protein [Flavobacterium sp.]
MSIRLFITSVLVLTFLSCKNEKKNDIENSIEQKQNEDEKLFKVAFDLKVKDNENIHLYYTQDGTINFTEENSMWREIKGSGDFQEVVFTMPEDILPTAIRIDLGYGKNPKQSPVDLKKFKISYYNKTIEANGGIIFDYFYPTVENTKRIEGTNSVERLNKEEIAGPILYPNENLLTKIREITTGM